MYADHLSYCIMLYSVYMHSLYYCMYTVVADFLDYHGTFVQHQHFIFNSSELIRVIR